MATKPREQKNMFYDEVATKGRPKKVLNDYGIETIEKLSAMQCTDEEIAAVMDISVDTLTRECNAKSFADAKKRGKENGKASLRRLQYKQAEKGNVSMLIWLGKQYLGQRDVQEVQTADNGVTINVHPATKESKNG